MRKITEPRLTLDYINYVKMFFFLTWHCNDDSLVSFPDPPPKRKGGSEEYSTSSQYGLAVAMDSAKSQAFEVSCWASVNWKVC